MNHIWEINLATAFLLSIVLTLTVIPRILKLAFRHKIFDEPDERKIHKRQVPRLGGLAFVPVIFAAMAILIMLNVATGSFQICQTLISETRHFACSFGAIAIAYIVGIIDDLHGVRYPLKFAVQITCGILLVTGGIVINDLHGLFFIHEIPLWISAPLTIFITVFVINAINLIDGIDGLAAGICTLAYLLYGVEFIQYGKALDSVLSFACIGSILPFFYYNVFGRAEKGKKIFMGDTGSMTLGVVICIESIRLISTVTPQEHHANPLVMAFAPLLIPCMDVARVFFFRIAHGKSPFLPDKKHIHHLLLAAGMSQWQAMATLVTTALVLTTLNNLLSFHLNATLVFGFDFLLWLIICAIIAASSDE